MVGKSRVLVLLLARFSLTADLRTCAPHCPRRARMPGASVRYMQHEHETCWLIIARDVPSCHRVVVTAEERLGVGDVSVGRALLADNGTSSGWVAVKELKLNYHHSDTRLCIYTEYANSI